MVSFVSMVAAVLLCLPPLAGAQSLPVNLFREADSRYMPMRVAAVINSRGIVTEQRVLVNISLLKGGQDGALLQDIPDGFPMSGAAVIAKDVHGNEWILRTAYRNKGMGYSIGKSQSTFPFSIKGPLQAAVSRSEYRELVHGSHQFDFQCTAPNANFLCCPITGVSQYNKYTLWESPVSSAKCTASVSNSIQPLGHRYALSASIHAFGVSASLAASVTHASNAVSHTITSNDGSMTVESIIPPSSMSVFSQHPSDSTVCSRDNFAIGSRPFVVPNVLFYDDLFRLAITNRTYVDKRGCSVADLGFYTSPGIVNNTDQLYQYQYIQRSFGNNNIPGTFSCDYSTPFLPPNPANASSSAEMRLECPHELPQYLVLSLKVPSQYLQPQFPFVSILDAPTVGVLDAKMGRLRLSVSLWASGEWDAVVSVTLKSCTFAAFAGVVGFPASTALASVFASITNRRINVSTAETFHLIQRGVNVSAAATTNATIGFCILQAVPNGVQGAHSLFPQLAAINITVVLLRDTSPRRLQRNYRPTSQSDANQRVAPPIHQGASVTRVRSSGRPTSASTFVSPSAHLKRRPSLAQRYRPLITPSVGAVRTPLTTQLNATDGVCAGPTVFNGVPTRDARRTATQVRWRSAYSQSLAADIMMPHECALAPSEPTTGDSIKAPEAPLPLPSPQGPYMLSPAQWPVDTVAVVAQGRGASEQHPLFHDNFTAKVAGPAGIASAPTSSGNANADSGDASTIPLPVAVPSSVLLPAAVACLVVGLIVFATFCVHHMYAAKKHQQYIDNNDPTTTTTAKGSLPPADKTSRRPSVVRGSDAANGPSSRRGSTRRSSTVKEAPNAKRRGNNTVDTSSSDSEEERERERERAATRRRSERRTSSSVPIPGSRRQSTRPPTNSARASIDPDRAPDMESDTELPRRSGRRRSSQRKG